MDESSSAARLPGTFWQAPLVGVACAWTLGIVADRYFSPAPMLSLAIAVGSVLAWVRMSRQAGPARQALLLAGAVVGCGMLCHHFTTRRVAGDDVSRFASEEPLPARLVGRVSSEPAIVLDDHAEPMRTMPGKDRLRFVLAVETCRLKGDSVKASGLVQVTVPLSGAPDYPHLHVADQVQVTGHLARPASRANPSDFDYAQMLHDQGIHALLGAQLVTLEEKGWQHSFQGWLGAIRGWGLRVIEELLPAHQGVAEALLLGESSGMSAADWEKYMRTGVLHVLAVSGSHLVVLAAFLDRLFRVMRLRRRPRAVLLMVILFSYALLTGGRPPAMRAAWMVTAWCIGVFLKRQVLPANALALAWLGVVVVRPGDVFDVGCQMSFLAVIVLLWALSIFTELAPEPDALARVVDESRPMAVSLLLAMLRWLGWLYLANLVVCVALLPMGMMRFHLVSLVTIAMGPLVVLCSEFALVSGFLMLFVAAILPPAAFVPAWFTHLSLSACEFLVDCSVKLPRGHLYVPDLPAWWVMLFYLALLLALTVPYLRRRWRWTIAGVVAWNLITCVLLWGPKPAGQFRCTFVAVGHGGCTVIETEAGRVVVYDAGALTGPDVTRRHIAPFLWQRGYYRIDEVVLSHADADHFNGLPALLDFFAVGQVTTTPSFADRNNRPVRLTLRTIERRRIPIRQVMAGDRWEVDDVAFTVLHPPAQGPAGIENVRSLVLKVEHGNRCVLLTGDLQDEGLAQVLAVPTARIDVLMSPHHGSKTSNVPALAAWARPRLVVSCQRRPLAGSRTSNAFEERGIPFLGTWPHGAVSIRAVQGKWHVETYRTQELFVIE